MCCCSVCKLWHILWIHLHQINLNDRNIVLISVYHRKWFWYFTKTKQKTAKIEKTGMKFSVCTLRCVIFSSKHSGYKYPLLLTKDSTSWIRIFCTFCTHKITSASLKVTLEMSIIRNIYTYVYPRPVA